MFTFLSGGTGTPKVLQGFRELIDDNELGVICNNGDDLTWNNLLVCPDLDTVLYLFSGELDLEKFWGVRNETFHALQTLKSLQDESWFNIGDRDLGLHLYRNKHLATKDLTQVTQMISQNWGIEAEILPMTNNSVRSIIGTPEGDLPFQEYFVKYNWGPEPTSVKFVGEKEDTSEEALALLTRSDSIIIGPSNPATSIGPIFSIAPIRDYFENYREKVLAISPIVGDRAYSGPSVKLMKAMDITPTVVGLAEHYQDHISKLVIAPSDRDQSSKIEDLGIEAIVLPIELQTQEQKVDLASSLLEIL